MDYFARDLKVFWGFVAVTQGEWVKEDLADTSDFVG